MTLTEVALWIIFAGMLVIVPCGCVFTRLRQEGRHPPSP
jgi:hypothetical protein